MCSCEFQSSFFSFGVLSERREGNGSRGGQSTCGAKKHPRINSRVDLISKTQNLEENDDLRVHDPRKSQLINGKVEWNEFILLRKW
jgi:hypothetical protein